VIRAALAAIVCVAVGFGAGYLAFGRDSDDASASTFNRKSLKTSPMFKDARCSREHGPFWSCRVYSRADTGRDYDVEIAGNGRCFHASAAKYGGRVAPFFMADSEGFSQDNDLPTAIYGWLVTKSDC
jgi:hypothetical protein